MQHDMPILSLKRYLPLPCAPARVGLQVHCLVDWLGQGCCWALLHAASDWPVTTGSDLAQ
jgi:hypothetical protein